MTLKTRLTQLRSQAGAASPAPPPSAPIPVASRLRQRLAHVRPERVQAASPSNGLRLTAEALAEAVNGQQLAPGLIRIEASIPLTDTWGRVALSGLKAIPRLPGEPDSGTAIYLDTETTGLAGGSGTLAFLVGLAEVKEDRLQLVQFLMTSFAAESALLSELAGCLPSDGGLVSFNGKSFDAPLLATRFRLQGLKTPLAGMAHLDLLHPTRRLFGQRWTDCRLLTLERELLGYTRTDDLPGSEAPEAWFRYMRAGQADALIKVIEHNRQDIISLAAGHAMLAQVVQDSHPYAVDLHALARWWAEVDETRALALLACAGNLCDDSQRLYAYLLRRAGQWDAAVAIWERLAEQGCRESLERLAKYHEHVSKDIATAARYCSRLPDSEESARRRRRLDGKLQQVG